MTYQLSLWIITPWAEHKLLDEPIQHVLQLAGLVSSVYNIAASLGVHLCLGTKLTAKVLARVCGE